jgi:hypothetical protein
MAGQLTRYCRFERKKWRGFNVVSSSSGVAPITNRSRRGVIRKATPPSA